MALPVITVTAAALINPQLEVLLAQRPEGKNMAGLWEFPGGKLEKGESPEASLVRELREELGITVEASQLHAIQFVSFPYETFHLLMFLYGCCEWNGDIQAHEHQSLEWSSLDKLTHYTMPPADEPLIAPLTHWVSTVGSSLMNHLR